MKPYYQDDWVTIYHGDCRELKVESDCVITDPPYGQTSLPWDRWVDGWVEAMNGVSMWCFGSLRMFMDHAADFSDWHLAQDVVWEKHNGSSFHADRFRRVHEQCAQFYRGQWKDVYRDVQFTNDATKRTVRRKERPAHMGEIADSTYVSHDGGPRLQRSVISVRSEHGRALHPTQKPTGIVVPFIRYSCPLGGTVYDPFMGSGTTSVSARQEGRKSICAEVSEEYCEIAANRMQQEVFDFSEAPLVAS